MHKLNFIYFNNDLQCFACGFFGGKNIGILIELSKRNLNFMIFGRKWVLDWVNSGIKGATWYLCTVEWRLLDRWHCRMSSTKYSYQIGIFIRKIKKSTAWYAQSAPKIITSRMYKQHTSENWTTVNAMRWPSSAVFPWFIFPKANLYLIFW